MSAPNWLPSLASYELLSRSCLMQFSLATYPEPSDCSGGRTLAGTVSLQAEKAFLAEETP